MIEIKAPNDFSAANKSDIPVIFLGGSIEMGKAELWQQRVAEDLVSEDVVLLNPRRDGWDEQWTPLASSFRLQVEWELAAQESSDAIIYYLDGTTKSPVTMMEIGLFVRAKRLFVCCPPTFWRAENVRVVCEKHGANLYESYDDLLEAVRRFINKTESTSK